MNISVIDSALNLVESELERVSRTLIETDPGALVAAAAALQRAAVDFSKVMQQVKGKSSSDRVLRVRIKKLASLMVSRREILIRHGVTVERALAALVPTASETATYAPAGATYARQPYGSVGRRSGEFRVLSA